jgi:PAT family beta-lactamase induction signal transducer AmpG
MATVAILGFTSGLPLNLTGATMQAWLQWAGVDLRYIGLLSLVGLPYTVKFLWSPLFDRFPIDGLGRRRGWIAITALALMVLLVLLPRTDPAGHLRLAALAAFGIAFASASADIVIDGYRTELLPPDQLGPGVALHQNLYKVGMLVAGSLALVLSDHLSWRAVYAIMALGLLPGAVAALYAPEPVDHGRPRTLREACVEPFRDLLGRRKAWELLAFILLYKLGDNLCVALSTIFFLGKGFSRTEIGLVGKTLGMACLIGGGFLGGWLMSRWSLKRSLWVFGVLQLIAMTGHLALSISGKSHVLLMVAIAVENTIFAMGSVAYVALIQRCCSLKNAATQFALLSSLAALGRVLFASPVGFLVRWFGWPVFFLFCMGMAVPGLLLLRRFDGWELAEPAP